MSTGFSYVWDAPDESNINIHFERKFSHSPIRTILEIEIQTENESIHLNLPYSLKDKIIKELNEERFNK